MHRSRLSIELMEVLQFLKYTYWQDRLNLMEGLTISEKELLDAQTSSISTDEVWELLVNGQISSLIGLLNGEAS
jgi:hypothetical protein